MGAISYEDIQELIDEIETGTIIDFSPEELQRVNHLLAILAQQGILPLEKGQSRTFLDNDVLALLKTITPF